MATMLCWALPVAANATFGGQNGKIAFSSTRDGGDRDIFVVDPVPGSVPVNVTPGMSSSNEDWPVWNGDGTRLAFHTDLHGAGNLEIYVIKPDGSIPPVNVTHEGLSDSTPTWSPDGAWIAYTRCSAGGNCDIWKRPSDGSGAPIQLTNHAATDTHPSWDTGGGGTIAFISNRPANGLFQLHIMDSFGNNETEQLSNQEEYNPNWDPTATKLIFDRNVGGEFDVVSRNYNGSGCCINWTPENDPFFDIEPSWSPDGTQFSWTSTRSGNHDIWIAPFGAYGGNLAPHGAEDRHSDWGVRAPKLVVVKNSIPDDPQDFTFTAGGGLTPSSFQLDDDSDGTLSNTRTFDYVTPGTYSLSEADPTPAGWDQTSATCNDGSPVSNISVSHFETVTCTFTNTKRGTIKIRKDTVPDGPTDFTYSDNIPGCTVGPLDDDGDNTLPNETTCSAAPASYTVTEADPTPAFDLTALSCDDGNSTVNTGTRTASISLQAGETVTCTFTNRKRGKLIVRKDVVIDEDITTDPQDFSFSAGGGLSPSTFQLDDDPNEPSLPSSITFDDLVPQSGYSISETLPGMGWALADVNCDDGSNAQNVTIDPGETVTCTFVNTRGYARPRGANPFRASLVVAYQACASPNREHGPPLDHPSCHPPAEASSRLTVGTPDANSTAANFVGFARLSVLNGDAFTPEDEADVRVQTSLSDVRNRADLTDYTGELQLSMGVRITDRFNDNSVALTAPGTSHASLAYTVPCTATAGAVGASCALTTTVDAVSPGAVVEIKRSIWALDAIRVFDGGPDGDAETAGGNTLFATQGVFIP